MNFLFTSHKPVKISYKKTLYTLRLKMKGGRGNKKIWERQRH